MTVVELDGMRTVTMLPGHNEALDQLIEFKYRRPIVRVMLTALGNKTGKTSAYPGYVFVKSMGWAQVKPAHNKIFDSSRPTIAGGCI